MVELLDQAKVAVSSHGRRFQTLEFERPGPPGGHPERLEQTDALDLALQLVGADIGVGDRSLGRPRVVRFQSRLEAYLPRTLPPAPQPARAEQLIGSWTSPFLTVSIQEEGTVATRLPDGTDSTGRWSIDQDGRLRADLMGEPQVADASVEGEWLTLSIAGQALKLRRSSAT